MSDRSDDKSSRRRRASMSRRRESETNGWSAATTENIIAIGNETQLYAWLHKKSAALISDAQGKTSLAAAILSVITSTGGIIAFLLALVTDDKIATLVIMGIATLVSTTVSIIAVVQKNYDYSEKILKHRDAESKYVALGYRIQEQIQKPMKARQNGDDMYSWISSAMRDISQIEDIPDDTLKIFSEKFDEKVPGIDAPRKMIIAEESSSYSDVDKDAIGDQVRTKTNEPANDLSATNTEQLKETIIEIRHSNENITSNGIISDQSETPTLNVSSDKKIKKIREELINRRNNLTKNPRERLHKKTEKVKDSVSRYLDYEISRATKSL